MDLNYLMNKRVDIAFKKALEIYKHFMIRNVQDLADIKSVIANYYPLGKIACHHSPITVGISTVYYVMKKNNNELLSLNYFHEVFGIDRKALKNCLDEIVKL